MDFDLNLLRVLVAVRRAGTVSRAAEELGMSQPGVSSALARLRGLLGDELFVRTGRGMEATPRADALLRDAEELLHRLTANVEQTLSFDPARSKPVFRLAMSDIGEMSVLPALLADLNDSAPGCTVHVDSLSVPQLKDALENGTIDLAVGYMPDLERAGFFQQQLFMHGFSCLLRRDHPIQSERLGLRDYEALGHVAVHTPVRSQDLVERHIAKRGIRRRVVLHTPHFMSLPVIVASTDLVATVPTAVGTVFANSGMVRLAKPPFASPKFAVRQHWHRRYHQDPKNQWIRARIQALFDGQWQLPAVLQAAGR